MEALKKLFNNFDSFLKTKSKDFSVKSRRQDINYLKGSITDTILKSKLQGEGLSISEIREILYHIETSVEQEILDRRDRALEVLREADMVDCSQSSK
jgi:hypothetical protein